MKKLLLSLAILLSIVALSSAQSCLPDGIEFSSQQEIDDFQANYPNCTEIEGDVGISGADITDLSGLSALSNIWGDLIIENNELLTDLTGLENLESVFVFKIASNNLLNDLTGLEGLTTVTNLRINYNDSIQDLSGLSSLVSCGLLEITGNENLTSMQGMENLTTIPGSLLIGHRGIGGGGNNSLTNFNGLSNLTSIGGGLSIMLNSALTDLSGLEGLTSISGDVKIAANFGITSLNGLNNLTSIGGQFWLQHGELVDLSGLENLSYIGEELIITTHPLLTTLSELENLTTVEGELWIAYNDSLESLDGLDNISPNTIDGLSIHDNDLLSECHVNSICDYLASPSGTLDIHDNAMGCNNVTEVETYCELIASVSDLYKGIDIILSPNPAVDHFTVVLDDVLVDEISIYNQTGQLVLKSYAKNALIDISGLLQGLYIVQINAGSKSIKKKLLIAEY